MEKRKEYKIIPVEFVDIQDGDYILNSSDGEEYRVTGDISTKKGSMIRVLDDTFLKLTNDIEQNNLEEIVILKDDVKREQFGESNVTSRERLTAVWPNMATKILVDKYKELKPRVLRSEIKSMKHMWELINEELGINGFHYELQQVESKWKSLIRSYRVRVSVGGKRKPNSFAAPFDKEIGEILSLLSQNDTDMDRIDSR
ncbi:uncharacterized protein LOC123308642 [Coccinella septempunctata]|uniref:uncharacterized protein LOC123308642 n=1 Tax=Coccinella septempunctata TaxID=41139 RepID=UPI001D07D626|nr:uncharacterized protein LOC123308642 [Coccinella septempunctata]XP_044747336.1 uncharacterized protein LOC123308642 [Coccinella septempunctata]